MKFIANLSLHHLHRAVNSWSTYTYIYYSLHTEFFVLEKIAEVGNENLYIFHGKHVIDWKVGLMGSLRRIYKDPAFHSNILVYGTYQ